MRDVIANAAELNRAGKPDEAESQLESLLEEEPANVAALHLLGVIHSQQGRPERALERIGQAVALRPGAPEFHVNLAEAYRNGGDLNRAEGCCRTALRMAPDSPEALGTYGLVLQGMGRLEEAAAQFRRALELRPEMARAHNDLGLILRELGRADEAAGYLRRAVELAPEFAAAWSNLGLALLDLDRPDEALPCSQEAVRLQPDVAIFRHNLGNALRALDRGVEARAAYLDALRLDPDLALTHLQIGLTLKREGLYAEALHWQEQAAELEPDRPLMWAQLADLHVLRQEPDAAIACGRRALALSQDPRDRAQLHVGLGRAFHEDGRLAEAAEHYGAAARLQPDLALARVGLGQLSEERGEMAEAEASYREAIRLEPGSRPAYARLGTLLRGKLPEPDLAALQKALADPKTNPVDRGRLLFALAHVNDARGEFARAADCLREANALNLEMAPESRAYVPSRHEQFVDALIRGYDAGFFERTAGGGSTTRRPVFVFGLPRSGTTLVEQVLSSHSRIHGAGELRLAQETFEAIPAALEVRELPLACLPLLTPAAVRSLAERHLGKLAEHDGGRADRVVDKMPGNYLHLGLLAALFPDAAFIHCRRDLRDVAVSCWMTDFRFDNIPWASDPEQIASRFRQYLRIMDHWRSILPAPILEVRYEEMVDDLEGVARRLLAVCRLDWEPACLEFHRTRRTVRTASITQVRQPIYHRSVARWRNYERELADLFERLPHEGAGMEAEPAYQGLYRSKGNLQRSHHPRA